MSIYRFRADNDNTLRIRTYADSTRVWASIGTPDGDIRGLHIPNADVPTVALELLKAVGQESVIVPRKLAGEVVTQKHALYCGGGDSEVAIEHHTPPARLRTIAANYIALAEYIEGAAAREAAEKAEAEAAEKKLQERRDALARRFGAGGGSYDATDYPMQLAIDGYIDLEDGASRD